MEYKITDIAERIRGLRELMDISVEDMARATDCTPEQYKTLESGRSDFSFTFLYKCAQTFGIDMIEILTGEQPKLSFYTVVRKGKGLPIRRRESFSYFHLASLFRDKAAEPFLVTAPWQPEKLAEPIALSTHEGQEFDYILSGSLEVDLEGHREVLTAGDSVYYDSGHGHGMRAIDGAPCTFLAVILKKPTEDEGK